MFGFGKARRDGEVERLAEELRKLQSVVRQLEGEQILMHDQVRKWMRRAVAAERVTGGRNQEPVTAATPALPERVSNARMRAAAQGRLWGSRSPSAVMRGQPPAQAAEDAPVSTNGEGGD